MLKWHPLPAQREYRPQEHPFPRVTPAMHFSSAWVTAFPCLSNQEADGINSVLTLQAFNQCSYTFLKRFRKPFKLGSKISILTKALFFSLPIPTQPEAMVARSTSSSERALKVHTLSQICWFHCYIPRGRQSTDVEPKNRKTEKQNKDSWNRHFLLQSKIRLQWIALSLQAEDNENLSNNRETQNGVKSACLSWRMPQHGRQMWMFNELNDDFTICFPFPISQIPIYWVFLHYKIPKC